VFNATFINISVISLRSVLLVEDTVVPGENVQPCRKLLTNVIRTHLYCGDIHWFHRYIQLPYDYDHDDPKSKKNRKYNG